MDTHDRIFVTGHRGLVGSAILRILENAGYRNLLTRTHRELDLTAQSDVDAFFAAERPDIVIHAAGKVGGIWANSTFPAEFIYQNTVMSTTVIHAAWKYGVQTLVNLGSSCIYPKHAPQPMSEDSLLTGPLEPTNEAYAIAKISAIKTCRYYNEQYGTNFFSLMPTNMYGPNDNFDLKTSHAIAALIRKFSDAAPDDTITLWGDGSPRREFMYVDDLANAIVYLLKNSDAAALKEQSTDYFVNVGTGQDVTIKELASMIAEIVGWNGEITWDTSMPNGTPRKLMDVRKINALGWRAETSLRDGLERAVQWYRQNVSRSR